MIDIDKKEFVCNMFGKDQIGFGSYQWKNGEYYNYRFNGGRGIENDSELLTMCAEQILTLIGNIAPETTHICGIPNAGNPVVKQISLISDIEILSYDKSWHTLHDFTRHLNIQGIDVTEQLDTFSPHGSYGELTGDVYDGAKVFGFDNVASFGCESKIEFIKIIHKLMGDTPFEISGIGVLQNNSSNAYNILNEQIFGTVLEAPETFGILRQEGYLTDAVYPSILENLERLGWFNDFGQKVYSGDKKIYNMLFEDHKQITIEL